MGMGFDDVKRKEIEKVPLIVYELERARDERAIKRLSASLMSSIILNILACLLMIKCT